MNCCIENACIKCECYGCFEIVNGHGIAKK